MLPIKNFFLYYLWILKINISYFFSYIDIRHYIDSHQTIFLLLKNKLPVSKSLNGKKKINSNGNIYIIWLENKLFTSLKLTFIIWSIYLYILFKYIKCIFSSDLTVENFRHVQQLMQFSWSWQAIIL